MDKIVLIRWDGVWVDQQEPARVRAAIRLRELGVTFTPTVMTPCVSVTLISGG